jgi:hypothetical protein
VKREHNENPRCGGRCFAGSAQVNAIALAPAEDFRRDSDLFGEGVRNPEAQNRIKAAITHQSPI